VKRDSSRTPTNPNGIRAGHQTAGASPSSRIVASTSRSTSCALTAVTRVALTSGKRSFEDFEWSPDGRALACLASEEPTKAEEEKEKNKDDARSVDRDDKLSRLWVVAATTGGFRLIVGAPWRFETVRWVSSDRVITIASDRYAEEPDCGCDRSSDRQLRVRT
jgi:dipeptidyl aminopeptidase/acylaminoacyl peptidase